MDPRPVFSDTSYWASHQHSYDHGSVQPQRATSVALSASSHSAHSSASPAMSHHQHPHGAYGAQLASYSGAGASQTFAYNAPAPQQQPAQGNQPHYSQVNMSGATQFMPIGYNAHAPQHNSTMPALYNGYSSIDHMYQQARNADGSPVGMANAASSSFAGLNPGESPMQRAKRKQVKNACVNCQKACKKCDEGRPCSRCVKYGLSDTCQDSTRKERKRGIKRGPYKRRATTGSTTGQPAFGHSHLGNRSPGFANGDIVSNQGGFAGSSVFGGMQRPNAPNAQYDGNSSSSSIYSREQHALRSAASSSLSVYERRGYGEDQKPHYFDADRSASTPAGSSSRPGLSPSNSYSSQLPSLNQQSAYTSGGSPYMAPAARPNPPNNSGLFSSPPTVSSNAGPSSNSYATSNSQNMHNRMHSDGSYGGSAAYPPMSASSGPLVSPRTPGVAEYVHHPPATTGTHLSPAAAGAFLRPVSSQSTFSLQLPQRVRGTTNADEQAMQHQHQQQQQIHYTSQSPQQQPQQLARAGYGASRYLGQREAGHDELAPLKREPQRVGPLGAA